MSQVEFLGFDKPSVHQTQQNIIFCCVAKGRCYSNELTGIGKGSDIEEAQRNARKNLDEVCREFTNTLNGGGLKPATEAQLDLIRSMCESRDMDMQQVIRSLTNKGINSLTGSDAHSIIRNLKEQNDNF